MDISIIIVNFKTEKLTLQTIASVFQADPPSGRIEVILVDNASQDNTGAKVRKKFPQVKIIQTDKNLGFAGGNNLGLRQAKGRYILLLNSDTIIQPDTLITMVKFMNENPQVGLSTCRVELVNGNIDPASHRGFPFPWAAFTYLSGLEKLFPHSPLFSRYHQGWKDLNTTHEIDSPVGAFFFLRQKALSQVGLLDEKFFMYGEDIDLAFRIKQAGWKIMYVPQTKITHLKGASGLNNQAKQSRLITTQNFFAAMKIFYSKHYQKKYLFPLRWLVFLGIDLLKQIRLLKIKLG
ncbi:MAG: glycosyltransferase family 2 protein [Candidatus Beckwithbacteria bacterium]